MTPVEEAFDFIDPVDVFRANMKEEVLPVAFGDEGWIFDIGMCILGDDRCVDA